MQQGTRAGDSMTLAGDSPISFPSGSLDCMKRGRKVAVGLVAMGITVLAIVSVVLVVTSTPPSIPGQKVPWIVGCGPPTTRYNLPINQSGATQYANSLIRDYNNLVSSREGQSGDFASIRHFFPLYHPVGQTFEVYVARDNQSSTDDLIEFFFFLTPGTNPQVSVLTNETAAELRPVTTSCPNEPVELSYDISTTPYWTMLSDVSTVSPLGVDYFPMIWITNMSSVFNSPYGAADAAQTIYNNGHAAYLQSLKPTFPSWAWLQYELTQLWGYFVAASVVFDTLVSYITLKDRRASQRSFVRRRRGSKEE